MRYSLRGLGDTSDTGAGGTSTQDSTSPSWLTSLITGVTGYFTGKQQLDAVNQINQINIQRAAQGLPPISVNLSQPGVTVGLNSSTQSLLMYGGLALGAVWLATSLLKRRR
jgi:hypothetical protein